MGFSDMKLIVFAVLLLLFSACKPISDKPVDKNNPKFSTTEDSELFFKNVRQVYYNLERQEQTKLDIYRHKKRQERSESPIINLAIAHNWRFDEAYLLIESNSYFRNFQDIQIHWKHEQSGETGIYFLEQKSNKNEYFRFASEIYASIIAKHTLWILDKKTKIPFLENQEEREVFKTTMKDYYRLVGLI